MKNCKRIVALAMATAVMAGSGLTVMAADGDPAPGTGGSTGTGSYEGYVEETSVFTVDVPTDASATKGFNFFVDPNGLLAGTNYARISGATAADFETGASLFFERTPDAGATPAIVKYGKDSEAITLTNKSSYAVNVEVSATVAGAEKITLGDVAADTTAPTIQLAIVSGEDTPKEAKITADGGKLTGEIEGETTNFTTKWNSTTNKYEYGLIDTPDNTKWKKYSFHLTGACGGTWTAEQAEVQPTVTLTWKVTDPKAGPRASGSLSTTNRSVTISGLSNGVTLKKAELIKTDNAAITMTQGSHYTFSNGTFTIAKSDFGDSTKYNSWKLTFSDDTTVTIAIQ